MQGNIIVTYNNTVREKCKHQYGQFYGNMHKHFFLNTYTETIIETTDFRHSTVNIHILKGFLHN